MSPEQRSISGKSVPSTFQASLPAEEPRKDGNLGNPASSDLKAVLLKDEPAFTWLSIPSQKVTNTILTPYPFVLCSPQLKELLQQLEMESEKRRQLEAQTCNLQEELSALRGSQEKLEKTNVQLQKEVAHLKDLLKTYKVGHEQKQQYETEIRKSLTGNKCSYQKSQDIFVFGVLPLTLSVRRCSPLAQKSL